MVRAKDRESLGKRLPGAGGRRVLYLDCFSGISGDMFLGMAVDLGVPLSHLRKELSRLRLKGYSLASRQVQRSGLWGTQVLVRIPGAAAESRKGHPHDEGLHAHTLAGAEHVHRRGETHRGIREIRRIIERSRLDRAIQRRSIRVFETLVEAEARVHRVPPARVHLHEVGAVDAIVDIVGACICLEALRPDRVIASALPTGSGTIECAHGVFPVPAPATAEILKGKPVYADGFRGELVTPTGAALVATLADEFGPMPPLRMLRVGHGAGSRNPAGRPNLLRGFLGELEEPAALLEKVAVLETTIDDLNPQVYGYLMERLFAAGALEVFFTSLQMKKNRPGTLVTVISPPERFDDVGEVIFRETTTIGFRYQRMDRIELGREIRRVRTPYGAVRVKVSLFRGKVVQATPEYEDCRAAALKAGVPLREVQRSAAEAFHRR
jgi:uncharacterized protein (TIGR00299 family) protein